jgi:hypothetical protein
MVSPAGRTTSILAKEHIMTMPKTAQQVVEFGSRRPAGLTDEELDRVVDCLRQDLPGAVDYVGRAAQKAKDGGSFVYLSRSPADMGSTEEWNVLVGYLARLFASPFVAIVREWTHRQQGVDVAFVNCCIVAAQPGEVDEDELWCLQSRMQLTPDC